jgi:diapolycopene oxygenase
MFGAFKPANRSRDIRGLYLAGGAAHPGPGMPMVLMSGWIAADALDRDARERSLHKPSLFETTTNGGSNDGAPRWKREVA